MKEYKGRGGIYCITNQVNGKKYVGKTKDFYKRYCQYVSDFRNQNTDRVNPHLRNAVLKDGVNNFEFTVLEFCDDKEEAAIQELYWMMRLGTLDRNLGYNLRADTTTGMITHPETSKKISERLKKEWESGQRSGHSEKLKDSWQFRDRATQSKQFSRALTKYEYYVYLDGGIRVVLYGELVDMGFKNAISSFHRKQCDDIVYKEVRIVRKTVEEKPQ